MRIDELKKSIWGYKVSDVCQYLSAVESRHAERIAELQEQAAQAEEQAQKRIGELEAELAALRRENEALLEKRQLTFDTLLAAQAYARQAREETRQHEEEARQKVADEAGRQMSELNDYAAKISKMRDDFRALLEELDGRTADVQMQLQELQAAAPVEAPQPQAGGAEPAETAFLKEDEKGQHGKIDQRRRSHFGSGQSGPVSHGILRQGERHL